MKVLLLIALYFFPLNGYSHESTWDESKFPNLVLEHRLWHKVRSSFKFVDMHIIKHDSSLKMKPKAYSYYFDDKTNSFYICTGPIDVPAASNNSKLCNHSEDRGGISSSQLEWISKVEILYGKQNDMLPVSVLRIPEVYFFEGKVPFQQSTTFYYYAGKGKVNRCRTTNNTYNFEFYRDGESIYFQSEKEVDIVAKCEQFYPRL